MNSLSRLVALAIIATLTTLSLCRSFGILPDELYRLQELMGGDKAAHFLMGTGVMTAALLVYPVKHTCWRLVGAFFVVVFLLAVDEFSQIWLISREFSLLDWVSGTAGALVASALQSICYCLRSKKLHKLNLKKSVRL